MTKNHKTKIQSNAEYESKKLERAAKAQRYFEKWAATDIGLGLKETYEIDPKRALQAAWRTEKQENYFKQNRLKEDTIRSNFGVLPEHVLKIVRIGSANSNRGQIWTEYPLETTDDAIFYLEYIRDKAVRDAAVGDKPMEKVNLWYSGERFFKNIGTGNGSTDSYTATMDNVPTAPRSYWIVVNEILVGIDDGAGKFTAIPNDANIVVDTTASAVDYSTGVVTAAFDANIPSGYVVKIVYNWDSEVESLYPQIGDISITIQKRRFNARPMPLGYNFTRLVEAQLGTEGFGDADEILIAGVAMEHAKRKDWQAIADSLWIAKTNQIETFDADFANFGEVSYKSHAQLLLTKLDDISGKVTDAIGRGELNKLVCGRTAITYVRQHDLFEPDNSQPNVGGTRYAGKLAGKYDVYTQVQDQAVAQLINKDDILATYKNPDVDGDVAIAYGVLTEFADQLTYPQHKIVGQISSVESKIVFENKMVRLLQLKNLKTG